jgi:hypothetical protein
VAGAGKALLQLGSKLLPIAAAACSTAAPKRLIQQKALEVPGVCSSAALHNVLIGHGPSRVRSESIRRHYVNPGRVLETKRLMDEQATGQDKLFLFT